MSTLAPVILSEYNPMWIDIFNTEKAMLLHGLGDRNIAIEHIGSTSILGATSKPEIDIMVGLDKLEVASKYIQLLEKIGYVYFQKFEAAIPERRYFRKSDGIIPLFHIHMVEKESSFWERHILFRDYLRSHPDDVKKYNTLKESLILEFPSDRQGYSKGKENFIAEIVKKAKSEKNVLGHRI